MLDRLRGRKRWDILDEGIQFNAKEIKETFHLFDMNHGGTLHFGDLECKLEDAGIEVEDSHIDHMMALIKKKGHMINFFQYLAIVNNLANYIEKIAGKKISKQKIYDILVKFMKRSALSNLSFLRANAPQVLHPRLPHVLKHYLVGVTLEGLTERQLVKRMEEMTNPSPPRRPRSGSVSRRRARADASLERRRGHSGIARSSSDQICYMKEDDRYLTSLISLTSVRNKYNERAKSPRPKLPPGSKSSPVSSKKKSVSNDGREDFKIGGKISYSLGSGHSPRKNNDPSSQSSRKSRSCDLDKKDSSGKAGRSSSTKSRRPAKTHKPRERRRPLTAQHYRGGPARSSISARSSAGAVLGSDSSVRRGKGREVKARNGSRNNNNSRRLSARSCLKFPDSIPTISGSIDIAQREYIKKYLQSSLNGESRSDVARTRSATVQAGGPRGDQPRIHRIRRSLEPSHTPKYSGMPYITPYYFPKMTFFDIPYIRNEMALRRRICSEVMSRRYEEHWRKRNLLRAYESISSPNLQKRFQQAVGAYGYTLK